MKKIYLNYVILFLFPVFLASCGSADQSDNSNGGINTNEDNNNNSNVISNDIKENNKFPSIRNGLTMKISKIEVVIETKDKSTGVIKKAGVLNNYLNNERTKYDTSWNHSDTTNVDLENQYFYFDTNKIYNCLYYKNSSFYENKNIIQFNQNEDEKKYNKIRLFYENLEENLAASWISNSYISYDTGYEFTHGESSNVQINKLNDGTIEIKSIDQTDNDTDTVDTFYDIITLSPILDQDQYIIQGGC